MAFNEVHWHPIEKPPLNKTKEREIMKCQEFRRQKYTSENPYKRTYPCKTIYKRRSAQFKEHFAKQNEENHDDTNLETFTNEEFDNREVDAYLDNRDFSDQSEFGEESRMSPLLALNQEEQSVTEIFADGDRGSDVPQISGNGVEGRKKKRSWGWKYITSIGDNYYICNQPECKQKWRIGESGVTISNVTKHFSKHHIDIFTQESNETIKRGAIESCNIKFVEWMRRRGHAFRHFGGRRTCVELLCFKPLKREQLITRYLPLVYSAYQTQVKYLFIV